MLNDVYIMLQIYRIRAIIESKNKVKKLSLILTESPSVIPVQLHLLPQVSKSHVTSNSYLRFLGFFQRLMTSPSSSYFFIAYLLNYN
jgi:hypothetical protein